MLRLPQKSNILSEIDLGLTPYLADPMSFIGDSEVKWIVIVAPTQSGKTVFLQTGVADTVYQDPGPCLYLLPDEKMGRKHIQEKVISVIEATPELAAHKTGYSKDMTKQGVVLDNMHLYLGWGGSLGSVSSFPMKRVYVDEARLMSLTVGAESNAIQLAEDRLTTYLNMGLGQGYVVSSPSVEGDLLHNQLTLGGTGVYFWQVPCPECGEFQVLSFFENVKKGICVCKFCGGEFGDKDNKRSWNAKGRYVRRRLNEDKKWEDGDALDSKDQLKKHDRIVFWWNSEVSPFRTFKRIYTKYMEVRNKLHDYKNFVQCWEANFWIDDISKTSSLKLKERRGTYNKGDVLDFVNVVTTGIDTQDNGFYVTVRGFGPRKRTQLIDEYYVKCDMHTCTREDVVTCFNDIFSRVYTGSTHAWKTSVTAIDTGGHRTKEIYEATSQFPRMILVKGKNNQRVRIQYNADLNLYLVRTCEYAEETEEACKSSTWYLPKNVSDDYCAQFCNFRKVRDKANKEGTEPIIWVKKGRNDYRMADIHTYICLDVQTDRGVLRHKIEEDGFVWNPYTEHLQVKQTQRGSSARHTNASEQEDNYVGNYGEDWV